MANRQRRAQCIKERSARACVFLVARPYRLRAAFCQNQTHAVMSDKFRTVVFEIAQNLSESDLETLVYIYRLPDSFKNVPPLRPLTELERRGVFSSLTPDSLADVLATIHRHDLVGLLRRYEPESEVVRRVSGLADVKRHANTTEGALAHAQLMEKRVVEIRDRFFAYNQTLTTCTVEERNTSRERIEEGLNQIQSGLQHYIMPVLSDMTNGGSKKSAVMPRIQPDPDLQRSKPAGVFCMHGQKILPPLRTFQLSLISFRVIIYYSCTYPCNMI